MKTSIPGLHHVTAIAGSPQQNVDFYVGVLGLRLVKRTVNFDDPGTYHLYYGDHTGSPGSILTFFPWPHGTRGAVGAGMTTSVAFTVPEGALSFWMDRFARAGLAFEGPSLVHGFLTLSLEDPDGLSVRLVESGGPSASVHGARGEDAVPAAYAIRSFDGIRLAVSSTAGTVQLLTRVFGFEEVGEESGVSRFRAPGGGAGAIVEVDLDLKPGRMGVGIIHHVAFRARDDEEQSHWYEAVSETGLRVTDVRDRHYFRSIYFREPGGVLFEIATDLPGFLIDEDVDELGRELRLPPWLEAHRTRIEREIPPLIVP